MIDSMLTYAVMVAAGMFLGAVFFGGLWMTVQQMQHTQRPGLLFVSSVVIRTGIVLAGIWYFAAGDGGAIAACLLGFLAIRLLATHGTAIFGRAFGRRESS
jgi:F1F0 ATPase subunit 2